MNVATAKLVLKVKTHDVNAWAGWFVSCAGIILAITGIAKLLSTFGSVKLLTVIDPILGIQFRYLIMVAGAVEWNIGFFCLFTKKTRLATALVAWMSTNFFVYRLGLWWMGWHRPCGCLGNLTDILHISPKTADNVMNVVLAFLLIGSYTLLVYQWRKARRARFEPKDEKGMPFEQRKAAE